jgi:GGDEF domain-containing protein
MNKRRLDELEFNADRDAVTGIPDRRAFLQEVDAETKIAKS